MQQATRVLIVEDDKFNVRLLSEVCRNLGFEADVAMDGLEALATIERNRPDLVLLDLMIPLLDGYGVLQRIRADPDTADLPVILVTAIQDREARARGIDLGADDWVAKPFKLLELQQRIHSALQMRAFKRQLTRDLTPPAGRARPKLFLDEAPALESVLHGLRAAGSAAQVITVEFSSDGPIEVVDAVLSAIRDRVPGGNGHLFLRSVRRHSVVVPLDALEARRFAGTLHAAGHARRAELNTTHPRMWWGVGGELSAADAACVGAREADMEPVLGATS